MKLAFIDVTTTVSFGGIQTAVWELAIALTDLGHQVSVLGGEGSIQPNLRGRSVQIVQFPFRPRQRFPKLGSRFQRIAERFSFACAAKDWLAAQDFDWIILTKPFDFFWPKLVPSCRARWAFMSGGTDFFRGDRYLAKSIQVWLACSYFNAWQIQHHYKRFPDVIYNGVDLQLFHPDKASMAVRRRFSPDPDAVLIGFAGRLVGWKGLRVAIEAMALPALNNSRAELVIIGDGEERPKLQALALSLGCQQRVHFVGAVAHGQLPEFYASMDIGVFPSIGDEAFGITIAEAMSCGLAVVASHIGGIPEVVGNEAQAGLLAAPGKAEDFASKLALLVEDAELRARLALGARTRIEQLYSWQLSAQRLLTALESACV